MTSWLALAGPGWTHEQEEQKLLPSLSAGGDQFGLSVAIFDETIVVGAPGRDVNGLADAGAVFVFGHDGLLFVEEAVLVASDPALLDRFGRAVAISGDVIAVAAPQADTSGLDAGAVYVFRRDGAVWVEEQKLLASDPAAGAAFGRSVSISGDTIVVGAPGDTGDEGKAYVFIHSGGAWIEEARVTASDGMPLNHFGISVSVSGERAVVGAQDANGAAQRTGAAYVFARTGTTWNEEAKIFASDGNPGDLFGFSVSIFDEIKLAVGAPFDDDFGAGSGTAYVYTRTGTTWAQTRKYQGASPGDQLGISVSHSYRSTVVGTKGNDDEGLDAGAATINVDLGNRVGYDIYVASDGVAGDALGSSVAAGTCFMVVGAPGRDDFGTSSGAVYVYVLSVPSATVRNGTGVNPPCMTTTVLPLVGLPWEVQVDASAVPSAAFTEVLTCAAPLVLPRLTPWGEVLVSRPSGPYSSSVVPGAGVNVHSMLIPDDPYFIGVTLYQQGIVRDGTFQILELCNAEDVRIGCHEAHR